MRSRPCSTCFVLQQFECHRVVVYWCRRGGKLLIHEALLDDAGVYSCHVINVIGSAISAANHVTVAKPST